MYDRVKQRKYYQKRKKQVLDKYGGNCQCCGENRLPFLTLDHINDSGYKHRKTIGVGPRGGHPFYLWIIRNEYPVGYETLCFNCNIGRHINKGVCPHKED